jgi:hypothetical protein
MARVKRINPTRLRDLQLYIRDLPANVSKTGSYSIKASAVELAESIRDNIRSQRFADSYQKFSDKYADWKQKEYGHLEFWRNAGELENMVEVVRYRMANNNVSFKVGFGGQAHSSGMTAKGLAETLELGLNNIPARPVVMPTIDEHRGDIGDTVKTVFKRHWKKFK